MAYYSYRKGIATAILMLTLSACATQYHVPVYDNIPEKITSTDVTVGLNQEELYVKFVRADSSATSAQFGLLGALIGSAIDASVNSSKSEDAEALAKSIRDAVVDVNFSDEFSTAVSAELSNVNWLKANDVKVAHSFDANNTKTYITQSNGGAALIITTNYFMSPDVKSFNINCNVVLYPNDEHAKMIAKQNRPDEEEPVLYRNNINYVYKLKAEVENQEAAVQEWIKGNAVTLKSAIREGVSKMAKMVAMDLTKTRSAGVQQESKPTEDGADSVETVVETGVNYKIARLPSGSLQATYQ